MKHTLTLLIAATAIFTLPSVAQAKTKVCNAKGECSIGHWKSCADIVIPSTWTCTVLGMARPAFGDKLVRQAGGRASVVIGGQTMAVISDELAARWSTKKPTANELEAALLNDKGSVSVKTAQDVARKLGLAIPR